MWRTGHSVIRLSRVIVEKSDCTHCDEAVPGRRDAEQRSLTVADKSFHPCKISVPATLVNGRIQRTHIVSSETRYHPFPASTRDISQTREENRAGGLIRRRRAGTSRMFFGRHVDGLRIRPSTRSDSSPVSLPSESSPISWTSCTNLCSTILNTPV